MAHRDMRARPSAHSRWKQRCSGAGGRVGSRGAKCGAKVRVTEAGRRDRPFLIRGFDSKVSRRSKEIGGFGGVRRNGMYWEIPTKLLGIVEPIARDHGL